MKFEKANENDYASVRAFYRKLIDEMQSENDKIGWKKVFIPRTIIWYAVLPTGSFTS